MARETNTRNIRKPGTTPYWYDEIARAIVRKAQGKTPFTNTAAKKACDWTNCACGGQSKLIETNSEGCPTDGLLYELGIDFMGAVTGVDPWADRDGESQHINVRGTSVTIRPRSQNPVRALSILQRIEKRVARLQTEALRVQQQE